MSWTNTSWWGEVQESSGLFHLGEYISIHFNLLQNFNQALGSNVCRLNNALVVTVFKGKSRVEDSHFPLLAQKTSSK